MDIKSVKSGLPYQVNNTFTTKQEEKKVKKEDSLNLSAEALSINKSQPNLELIKSRINLGFYNSPEVLDKVADGILKDLQSK